MHSDVQSIRLVLRKQAELLTRSPSFPWYARVPSASNCSDRVSRMEKPQILGAKEVKVRIGDFIQAKRKWKTRRLQ